MTHNKQTQLFKRIDVMSGQAQAQNENSGRQHFVISIGYEKTSFCPGCLPNDYRYQHFQSRHLDSLTGSDGISKPPLLTVTL